MVDRTELRHEGSLLLAEARELRAAFPDVGAMSGLPVSSLPEGPCDGEGLADRRAALAYLRDEMLVVRAGRAADLTVLDDEMANVERLFRDS